MLQPKFNVCIVNANEDLEFSDITGAFNNPGNTSGWGIQNDELLDVSNAYFRIEFPTGDIFDYNVTLPLLNGTITNGIIPLGTFPIDPIDGIYKITYNISTENNSYSVIQKKLFTPGIDCAIDKMFLKFVECQYKHNCNNNCDLSELSQLDSLRYALKIAGYTRNETWIKKHIELLNTLIETGCNCCD
jgi:hypothetical protein